MAKDYKEWIRQSQYDFDAAQVLFENDKFTHAVFLCHLSIEKFLKGFYLKVFDKEPPKLHSLIFFIESIGLEVPSNYKKFVLDIEDASIASRYPDSITNLSAKFDEYIAGIINNNTNEFLEWLHTEFKKY